VTAPRSGRFIVDAQLHLWAEDAGDRSWPEQGRRYAADPPTTSSASRAPLRATEAIAEMDRVGVDMAVAVPPVFAGDDNRPALAAAHAHPDRFVVMGRIALDDPRSAAMLPAWMADPSMVGIRLTFFWESHRRWLHDGTADWFWPLAEQYDIPVAVLAPGSTAEIAAVARRHPGLRMIVDHFGMRLDRKDAAALQAVDELLPLSELKNVAIKASTLPSYVTDPYPFPSLREPIRRVVTAFGSERVFWGSEMTRLPCSYDQAVTHFTEHLDFLSEVDLAWIMGRGIQEWLRIGAV